MKRRAPGTGWMVVGAVAAAATTAGVYAWATRPDPIPAPVFIVAPAGGPAPVEAARPAPDDIDGIRTALARQPDEVKRADLSLRLGDLCRAAGRFDEARAAYTEAADTRQRRDGPRHWQVREARAKATDLAEVPAGAATAYARRAEAERLLTRGQYADAHRAASAALDAIQAARGPDHADTADAFLLLGIASAQHGDFYVEAESVLTIARTRLAATRGEDHPSYGDCLHWLGTLVDARGDFATAEQHYTQAMNVHRAARGRASAEYARSQNRYGRMSQTWWKDYASGKLFEAQAIREDVLGRQHPDYAESLEDLAQIALSAPDYVKAERLLREALAIREKAQGPDHPDLAEPLSWLGIVLDSQGDLSQSQAKLRRAIWLAERARGPDHPLVARYLANLADTLGKREVDWQHNERYGRRALQIWDRAGLARHPDYAAALCSVTYSILDNNSNLYGPEEFPIAELDRSYRELERFYQTTPGGEDLPGYPRVLCQRTHLAYYSAYRCLGWEECGQLLVRAKAALDRTGGRDHPNYPFYLFAVTYMHMSVGHYADGLRACDELDDLVRTRYGKGDPWINIMAYVCRGSLYLHQGDLPRARSVIGEALDFRREIFDRNAHGQSDRERIFQVADTHYMLCGYLSALAEAGDASDCYRDVLRIRGAAAAYQVEDRLAYDRPDLRKRLDQIRQSRRELAALAFRSPTDGDREAWQNEVYRAEERLTDQETDLALKVREVAPISPSPSPEIADVQAALPPGTVLVDFLQYLHFHSPKKLPGRNRFERRLAAFVVRADGKPVFVPLGSSEDIKKAVEPWRAALADRRADRTAVDQAAAKIAQLVWQPLTPYLGSATTVLVAPDGPVCFLSFAALPGRTPGRYLLEDYAFGYLPAGRAVTALTARRTDKPGQGLLAVGGIQYAGRAGGAQLVSQVRGMSVANAPWTDLPCTGAEVKLVEAQFRKARGGETVQVLSGREADVDRFGRALERPWRCVHFAGHGFFADPATDTSLSGARGVKLASEWGMVPKEWHAFGRNQLLLSGLVFSPSDRPDGGVLTAEEIGGFDLRGTELVVLSACETGLGGSAGGEGVLGLQRAFLGAGVGCVVTSLWKVNDAATSVLMEEFYTNLWDKKLSKWEALRQAQLTVLKNPNRVRERGRELLRGLKPGTTIDLPEPDSGSGDRRPDLWAAFVVSGDGR